MAKKEVKYICEVCGDKFLDEKVANQCEKNHYKAVEITGVSYELDDRKKEFPSKINVKLVNGEGKEKIIAYTRKG